MNTRTFLLFFAVAGMALVCSCRLTRADVTGTWKVSADQTLYVFPNNLFTLKNTGEPGKSGTWKVYKKTFLLKFEDSLQHYGRSRVSYQYMWIKGSKKSLFRPATYLHPTNQFTAISKIE